MCAKHGKTMQPTFLYLIILATLKMNSNYTAILWSSGTTQSFLHTVGDTLPSCHMSLQLETHYPHVTWAYSWGHTILTSCQRYGNVHTIMSCHLMWAGLHVWDIVCL